MLLFHRLIKEPSATKRNNLFLDPFAEAELAFGYIVRLLRKIDTEYQENSNQIGVFLVEETWMFFFDKMQVRTSL